MTKDNFRASLGIALMLTVIMIIFKITGITYADWITVLIPLWIVPAIVLSTGIFMVFSAWVIVFITFLNEYRHGKNDGR